MSDDEVPEEVLSFLDGIPERIEIARLAVRVRTVTITQGKMILALQAGNREDFDEAAKRWFAEDKKFMELIREYIGAIGDD